MIDENNEPTWLEDLNTGNNLYLNTMSADIQRCACELDVHECTVQLFKGRQLEEIESLLARREIFENAVQILIEQLSFQDSEKIRVFQESFRSAIVHRQQYNAILGITWYKPPIAST